MNPGCLHQFGFDIVFAGINTIVKQSMLRPRSELNHHYENRHGSFHSGMTRKWGAGCCCHGLVHCICSYFEY